MDVMCFYKVCRADFMLKTVSNFSGSVNSIQMQHFVYKCRIYNNFPKIVSV